MPVSEKKRAYAARFCDYIENYKSAFIVFCDNVGSKQMQKIRVTLRGQAVVLMGKNTTMRKVIKDFLKKNEGHPIENLLEHIVGNVGLIFSNGDMNKIREVIAANKVPAPARVGSIAPVDVFVEPGPTGTDPGQTAWFQALNIPTKINKGQIEMISRVHLIHAGAKVGDSQAALLQKLNIRPFSYGLQVLKVYDNGAVFDIAVLDVKDEELLEKFAAGLSTFAAVCLGLGYPTKASAVHSINDAFKAILSIGFGTEYKFKRATDFEAGLSAAAAAGPAAGAPAAAAGGAPAAAKVEEKKEVRVRRCVRRVVRVRGGQPARVRAGRRLAARVPVAVSPRAHPAPGLTTATGTVPPLTRCRRRRRKWAAPAACLAAATTTTGKLGARARRARVAAGCPARSESPDICDASCMIVRMHRYVTSGVVDTSAAAGAGASLQLSLIRDTLLGCTTPADTVHGRDRKS